MVLIKACDISNEVRPMEVSEPWVDCLLEEYFNQVNYNHYKIILKCILLSVNNYHAHY